MECHYLNKNAFISVVGFPTKPEQHFKLKRKPKAAALKAELMNKSQEAQNKMKSSSAGAFPIRKSTMPRRIGSDLAPLKGLSGRSSLGSGFRSQRPNMQNRPIRKPEGGVKLLDINEQPIGFTARGKRKRQQELEEQEKKKVADGANLNNNPNKPNANNENNSGNTNSGKASLDKPPPDYAPPTPAAPPPPNYAPPTPAYAPQQNSIDPPQLPVRAAVPPQLPTQPQPPTSVLIASQQPQQQQPILAASLTSQARPATAATAFPASLSSLKPLPQAAVRGTTLQQSQPPP